MQKMAGKAAKLEKVKKKGKVRIDRADNGFPGKLTETQFAPARSLIKFSNSAAGEFRGWKTLCRLRV